MIELGEQIDETTFGGYPVTIQESNIGVLVACKGVVGTLDQLEYWLFNHVRSPYEKFTFGEGAKEAEIVRDGNLVKIACLQEEYVGFKLKLNNLIHGVNRAKNRK
jgi:hypothetical protein